jgi:homoserine O-acetyltransferase
VRFVSAMSAAETSPTAHATPAPGDVGLVTPRDFVSTEPFTFDSGQTLPGLTLRYETYGKLNATGDNAVLICHALSGDHHCAGRHAATDRKPGWWNNLIGPGKAVDTDKYFVLCANVPGGCQGSSGPASLNPATGRPFGMTFPFVTIRDMVRAQKIWLDALGVKKLHAAIGGSMGGMQALQIGIEWPGFCQRLLVLAATAHENAQAIAFNEVGRQAVMQDPEWRGGDYPTGGGPRVGLAIARMMAHITYLSDASMDRKFGRKTVKKNGGGALAEEHSQLSMEGGAVTGLAPAAVEMKFEVESYLRHQGESFINRFDANSYLYITRAIDHFDLPAAYGSLDAAFAPVESDTLVVGFTSDWLFPPAQNRAIAHALLRAGKRASYAELDTDLGHDSFLLESPQLYGLVRGFLA